MKDQDYARRVVENYARGVICSGEVFNQYVDHISADTVDVYMMALSPELIIRFRQNLDFKGEHPLATSGDLERWRHAESLIEEWLKQKHPAKSD